MYETSSLELLHALIRQAQTKLAPVGRTVGIVLAPAAVVFDAMTLSRSVAGEPPLAGGTDACFLCEGVIVLGLTHPPGHPQSDFVSVWSDAQFVVPDHDQNDQDDHPHKCPLFRPKPDPASNPFEHSMWEIQMADWLAAISPTVSVMLQTAPVISAKILAP